LFIQQIKAGKPLTVTDPGMTRFMMSLPESVALVLYAFEKAAPGDIFVQKSPAATIHDLAVALKDIFEACNEIHVIGPRHAEKMHETLCSKEEMSKAEDLEQYYRIPADLRDLNYARYLQEDFPTLVDEEYNSSNARRLSVDELTSVLLALDYVKDELRSVA
jgi:UDP-glucose 4-epimerase